jgi:PAS domain S-box-containing protein
MADRTTILAVDDDNMDLEMLDLILSGDDCKVIKAENGMQALQMLEENPGIDAVLLDLEMPVMNGYTFISHAKQSSLWCDIPILVLTGTAGDVNRTLAMGASDFVAKPFNREELMLRVMNQVRIKKNADLAREYLQRSEARFGQLLQATDQGIFSTDSNGYCTFINRSGLDMLGFKLEECLGKHVRDFIQHCHLEDMTHRVDDFQIFQSLGRNRQNWKDSEILWRKDGTCFPADFSLNPFFENDTVCGSVITFSDITARKQFEEERLKLSRAVEQCPVSIVITDVKGLIEFVNPKFTELTGYTAEDVAGQTPRLFKSGETPPETYEQLWSTISKGTTWAGELLNKSKDGKLFWESATISAIRDHNGAIIHYLAVKEDITEKKNMLVQLTTAKEQAEAASQAKSSFLATMSHEIRTPMNGVIGMTGMLLETKLTQEQREFTEIVRRSGENLLTIINEILDFSKIEAGKLDLEILDFDLRVALEDTAEMLALRANDAGLELICRIDPAVPSHLKGDPGRLRQIVINLVGNAIKFTQKGEVVINATLQSEQDGWATILFEVMDTGIGIPESRLAAIFDPFTQADGSTTRKFGGTGLGLAICKQLTMLMNGEIGIRSTEGVGSVFWFMVSFEKQATQAAGIQKNEPAVSRAALAASRILVVDDNSTNRKLMNTLLKYWGLRHELAASGRDGLTMLRAAVQANDPFNIALLDQEMPDMDGMELGRLIKADPLLASTLMIMVTSLARRGDAAVLEEIGFAGYLPKPVRQAQLYGCLELVLARNTAAQDDEAPQPQGIVTRHTIAESSRQGVRILLAEDNAINQKVAQHMLRTLGYKADVVSDGLEAVRALEMIDYDLVLMDCMMPEMDGFAATAMIRDAGSNVLNHTVPIIAMTANAAVGDRQKCLETGMDDYLSKPVNKDKMAELIEKWFNPDGRKEKQLLDTDDTTRTLSVFDRADMLVRMENDQDFVRMILDESLRELPQQLEELRALCRGEDAVSLRRQAHSMKGVAGNISAPVLRDICYRVETAAKANDIQTAQELLPELERAVQLTIEAIT